MNLFGRYNANRQGEDQQNGNNQDKREIEVENLDRDNDKSRDESPPAFESMDALQKRFSQKTKDIMNRISS